MKEITTRQELDDVFGERLAIIFKHSTRCGISASARIEMERFLHWHSRVRVYCIDVHKSRELSSEAERRTGVEHESPQVILLQQGTPVWHASHFEITARALFEASRA